jgi:hypothetical protein
MLVRIWRACLPMTASGALLALLCNLPRLLLDRQLSAIAGATFGVAHAASSGVALLFNSAWVYELRTLPRGNAKADRRTLKAAAARLTRAFLLILLIISIVLALVQTPFLSVFKITPESLLVFPAVFFLLTLQHAFSVNRDILKLTGQYWTEAMILLAAIALAMLAFGIGQIASVDWPVTAAAMVISAIAMQVGASRFFLRDVDARL